MQEKALLLTAAYPSTDDQRAERLLDFFGVHYLKRRATELGLPENKSAGKYRLVCSAQGFARVVGDLQNVSRNSNCLARQIHSVFLYSNGDPVAHGAAHAVRLICDVPLGNTLCSSAN